MAELVRVRFDGGVEKNVGASLAKKVGLTVLDDDWYNQLSLLGRAVETREDPDLADIDGLSQRYLGEPYEVRDYNGVSVLVEIDRYHTWGNPAVDGG